MAGLIAHLTAAARRRKTKKDVGANKCMYSLDPFDRSGFRKEVHNEYLVEMKLWNEQQMKVARENKMILDHWTRLQVDNRLYCQSQTSTVFSLIIIPCLGREG